MANILCVGVATLDYTLDVSQFPHEDSEIRAFAAAVQPGGNATNSAYVLAQAGHQVQLAAVLAMDSAAAALRGLLERRGIDCAACRQHPGQTPASHIVRSQATGSRTIVHYRDLPELGADEFAQIDLTTTDWVHFEGRHPEALRIMLRRARRVLVDQPISLELEKPRPGLSKLAEIPRQADVLIYSRNWARHVSGETVEPEYFLDLIKNVFSDQIQILTWGQQGAWLIQNGRVVHRPATPGLVVRDSIGAGDTFNAGIINALVSGASPEESLHQAVSLAERKLGQIGLDGLSASRFGQE